MGDRRFQKLVMFDRLRGFGADGSRDGQRIGIGVAVGQISAAGGKVERQAVRRDAPGTTFDAWLGDVQNLVRIVQRRCKRVGVLAAKTEIRPRDAGRGTEAIAFIPVPADLRREHRRVGEFKITQATLALLIELRSEKAWINRAAQLDAVIVADLLRAQVRLQRALGPRKREVGQMPDAVGIIQMRRSRAGADAAIRTVGEIHRAVQDDARLHFTAPVRLTIRPRRQRQMAREFQRRRRLPGEICDPFPALRRQHGVEQMQIKICVAGKIQPAAGDVQSGVHIKATLGHPHRQIGERKLRRLPERGHPKTFEIQVRRGRVRERAGQFHGEGEKFVPFTKGRSGIDQRIRR